MGWVVLDLKSLKLFVTLIEHAGIPVPAKYLLGQGIRTSLTYYFVVGYMLHLEVSYFSNLQLSKSDYKTIS